MPWLIIFVKWGMIQSYSIEFHLSLMSHGLWVWTSSKEDPLSGRQPDPLPRITTIPGWRRPHHCRFSNHISHDKSKPSRRRKEAIRFEKRKRQATTQPNPTQLDPMTDWLNEIMRQIQSACCFPRSHHVLLYDVSSPLSPPRLYISFHSSLFTILASAGKRGPRVKRKELKEVTWCRRWFGYVYLSSHLLSFARFTSNYCKSQESGTLFSFPIFLFPLPSFLIIIIIIKY